MKVCLSDWLNVCPTGRCCRRRTKTQYPKTIFVFSEITFGSYWVLICNPRNSDGWITESLIVVGWNIDDWTPTQPLSLRQLSVEVRKLVELKTTLVAGTGGGGLIWINVFWKPAWVGFIVELVKLLLGGDSRLVKMFHICQVKIYTLKIVINFEKLSKLS